MHEYSQYGKNCSNILLNCIFLCTIQVWKESMYENNAPFFKTWCLYVRTKMDTSYTHSNVGGFEVHKNVMKKACTTFVDEFWAATLTCIPIWVLGLTIIKLDNIISYSVSLWKHLPDAWLKCSWMIDRKND